MVLRAEDIVREKWALSGACGVSMVVEETNIMTFAMKRNQLGEGSYWGQVREGGKRAGQVRSL